MGEHIASQEFRGDTTDLSFWAGEWATSKFEPKGLNNAGRLSAQVRESGPLSAHVLQGTIRKPPGGAQ